MSLFQQCLMLLLQWIRSTVQKSLMRVWGAFPAAAAAVHILMATPQHQGRETCDSQTEEWRTNEALRTYHLRDERAGPQVTVQTDTHAFYVSRILSITHIGTLPTTFLSTGKLLHSPKWAWFCM